MATAVMTVPQGPAVVPVWHVRRNFGDLQQILSTLTDTPFETTLRASAHPDDSDYAVIAAVVPAHKVAWFVDWDGGWSGRFQIMLSDWETILDGRGINGRVMRAYWVDRSLRDYVDTSSITG